MLNTAIWNVRGLNRRDHQVAVRDLVNEFRLHFIALLETRVMQSNVTRIQSGVLSRWRWFVDYAGKVSARRELWQGLIELAVTIGNVSWLVGGDFNAVLDMSEVSLFRFDNYLALSPGFLASVQSIWRHPVIGSLMYSVTRKLKALKSVFRQQRRSKGDLAMNVKLAAGYAATESEASMAERWRPMLQGGDWTDRVIDLRYLRPWARHILTDDEARSIIRPVTIDEVKTAFFDIEEDKAPGADGFSSGFFKAAWPVVAQELFSVYNQCRLPPRCALKVDLRKAYDTVEWDFLIATLRMFGFPAVFIGWIEECVTSAHYSVVVNGGVHGFFAGARGLRQGDPMSPYLFVLVMELLHMILQQLIDQDGEFQYHWRCKDLNLFQLSFADDLLLFCKADVRSVFLFGRGLDTFATLSGLHTNPQKSQLIISKAASGLRDSLLATVGFQEGHLPKIDSRIKGWEGVQLSFAGRVQLIKSVLISFEVYWAAAFILPKGIINEMIKRLRSFLWKVIKQNRTSIWVDWIIQIRLPDCSIWTVKDNKGAWGWRKMLSLRHSLVSQIHFFVGNGDSISLWHDPWHPLGPLISRFPRGPQLTNTGLLDKISVVIEDGQWNWPMITDIAYLEITYMLPLFRRARTELVGSLRIIQHLDSLRTLPPTGTQGFLVLTDDGPLQNPEKLFYPLACYHGEIVYFG
ncbi:Retrovirus-related Pol polyprotein from type-2 retrotransposable element R2DM [Sesamum angolense]|uniref:Retrovirus-related Pol polyprotein from type-2 retrotransposable element R2DM n=1 Tax=Sesamum angolense TaxID=2727404 RepID=A0AAE1T9M9_9LAMI|nr:Retrovirus-related Pol polyprotein from type-2 retrotransposable element R2DM [Sesamum angolense]